MCEVMPRGTTGEPVRRSFKFRRDVILKNSERKQMRTHRQSYTIMITQAE